MRCYRVTCWPVTHPGRLERLGRFRSVSVAGAVAERLVSGEYAHEAAVYEVTDEGAPDEAPRAVSCRQLAVFAAPDPEAAPIRTVACARCGCDLRRHPDEPVTAPRLCADCWRRSTDADILALDGGPR